MEVIIVLGANSVTGPVVADALRRNGTPFWSVHSLYKGTPGREGDRWTNQVPAAARTCVLLAAALGGIGYVLSCKSEDFWEAPAAAAEAALGGLNVRWEHALDLARDAATNAEELG